MRTRRAGFPIVALRDAVLVRQLDFDQQHDMRSWKGYYMYRNLFVVHLRYGENVLVRLKPYLIALGGPCSPSLRRRPGRGGATSSAQRATPPPGPDPAAARGRGTRTR